MNDSKKNVFSSGNTFLILPEKWIFIVAMREESMYPGNFSMIFCYHFAFMPNKDDYLHIFCKIQFNINSSQCFEEI